MKFILAEDKFVLNESSKFILDERFILEEDILLEAQATLKQLVIDLNKLDTLLPNLLSGLATSNSISIPTDAKLTGDKISIEKEIKQNCAEVQDLLTTKKDFKAFTAEIRTKATLKDSSFTDEEVKILQPLCYQIANDGTSIKDALKNIKSNKGEISDQISKLQSRLPKLIDGLKALYKFFEKEEKKEPVEKPTVNPATQRIQLDMLFEKVFKKLPEAKAKYNGENIAIDKLLNIKDDADRLAILQYCCGERAVSNLSDNAKTMFTTITADTKYPTLDQLWQLYYKWSWGAFSETVKKLHNILYPQLFKNGFSEKVNVLVNFLRRIFIITSITPQAFAGITALYEKQKITAAELGAITNASATIAADNTKAITMLLCPALYKLTDSNYVFRLVTQSKSVIEDLKIDQIQGSANEAQKKLAVLSFCFTAKPDIDVAAEPLAELNKILVDDATKNELYSISNKECLLSPDATLLDETLIKRRIVAFTNSSESNTKTVLNSDAGAKNMWLKITEHYKFKEDIAKLFHFILARHAASADTYTACAKIISKQLFGTESEKLVADSSEELPKRLKTYLDIINKINLADSHLLPTIKLLFAEANMPKDLT